MDATLLISIDGVVGRTDTVKRQMRKCFLSAHRLIVTVNRPNLSFRFERNQTVKAFPFLILKNSFRSGPTPERAPGTLATAAAPQS